jgi:hypothetical protein
VQPGTSITPPALRRGQRNAQRLGTLRHRQSGKVPELDELGLGSILEREFLQGFIEGKDVLGKPGRLRLGEVQPVPITASTECFLSARVLDQDPAHGLGRGRIEVAATVPALGLLHVHKSYVRLVDQSGGLERLARFFMSHFFECEPPQFLIDQRQQLLRGVVLAAFDGTQDSSDLAHEVQDNRRGDDGQIRPVEPSQSGITALYSGTGVASQIRTFMSM